MSDAPDPSPTAVEPLRLEVVPEPVRADLADAVRTALASHSIVRSRYPDADLWVVDVDVLDKEPPDGDDGNVAFRAVVADLAGNDVAEAEGALWDPEGLLVFPTARPRLPSDDEYAWAFDVLRGDAELAARIEAGEVELYRPIPPLTTEQDADGGVMRAVAVGVREQLGDGRVRHRVVAVRAVDGEVLEEVPGLPPPAERECGLPDSPSVAAVAGDQQARVRLWRGEELLWEFVVVRPAASTGATGSGVELRHVEFQRYRVLHRAHLPIVNVAYDGATGARDWLNEESPFEAEGEDAVPGFRVCSAAPRTILERGAGGGEFRGVALWLDGEELVVTSQLQAGWYRYVSEWRLHASGRIQPRFGVAAVRNPVSCEPHTHHAYWRLDFDITRPGENLVQEFNEPRLPGQLAPWHTIRYEVMRRREPGRERQWRVRTVRSPHGYAIIPGPDDGTADAFGAGDVWVLAAHGEELDDGQGVTTDPAMARAQLDRLVSAELVEREDVLVWYGIHVRHESGEADEQGRRIGPDLEPFNWKPRTERAPYAPLVPPESSAPGDDEDEEDEDEADDDEAE